MRGRWKLVSIAFLCSGTGHQGKEDGFALRSGIAGRFHRADAGRCGDGATRIGSARHSRVWSVVLGVASRWAPPGERLKGAEATWGDVGDARAGGAAAVEHLGSEMQARWVRPGLFARRRSVSARGPPANRHLM